MTDRRKNLGDFGEQAVVAYLLRQGWQLLAHKWRCAGGEIDLVLRDQATLVFVEVRSRRSRALGWPEESVNTNKQLRLIALAYTYIEQQAISEATPWRIDVVAVDIGQSGRVVRLEHIRNAIEERS